MHVSRDNEEFPDFATIAGTNRPYGYEWPGRDVPSMNMLLPSRVSASHVLG